MIKQHWWELLFGLLFGGWWNWCRQRDARMLRTEWVESHAGSSTDPAPGNRSSEVWKQFIIIRVTTNADYLYPAFRARSRWAGVSVRLGNPIHMNGRQEILLRYGVGKKPCEFGAAVAYCEGARCGASLKIEYRVIREPSGTCVYIGLDREPLDLPSVEPNYDVHV